MLKEFLSPGRRGIPRGGLLALRGVSFLVLSLFLAGAFAGCRREAPASHTVVILADRDVEGLDPHLAGHIRQTQSVLANMYEGLVASDREMRIVPLLAETWSNPDDLTWDFELRKGVAFHTGGQMSADDVVFSLQRAQSHPKSTLREILPGVVIQKLSPSRIRLKTPEADAFLLSQIRSIGIVSKAFFESSKEGVLETASAGTGPYFLEAREPGTSVTMRRFDGYWQAPAEIERGITLARSYGDESLSSLVPPGSFVVFFAHPGSDLAKKGIAESQPSIVPSLSVVYIGFDLRNAETNGVRLASGRKTNPFLDRRVREAVSLALDLDLLEKRALAGEGFLPTQMVSPLIFGYDPSISRKTRDLERAKQLLDEAGYGKGLELELDVRDIMGSYGNPIGRDLEALGWQVRVNRLNEAEFFQRLSQGKSSMFVLRFSCRSGDAQELLDRWVRSKDAKQGFGRANYSYDKCPVPELDGFIAAARRDLNPESRKKRLQKVMRVVSSEFLTVPVFIEQQVAFISKGLVWETRADSARVLYEAHLARK